MRTVVEPRHDLPETPLICPKISRHRELTKPKPPRLLKNLNSLRADFSFLPESGITHFIGSKRKLIAHESGCRVLQFAKREATRRAKNELNKVSSICTAPIGTIRLVVNLVTLRRSQLFRLFSCWVYNFFDAL